MNGRQSENIRYIRLINNVVNGKPEEVRGFLNYISVDMSLSSEYSYLNHVCLFMDWVNKRGSDLTLNDFSAYMNEIKIQENGEETTPSYRITVYSALKRFSTYLYRTNIIPENYMDSIPRPKAKELMKTEIRREVGYLDDQELQLYLKNVKESNTSKKRKPSKVWKQRDLAIITLFLNTGIRCSALKKLDVSDVNFEEHTISVMDKGDKINIHMISSGTEKEIKKWLEYRSNLVRPDENALFISQFHNRISQDAISDITRKYAANIKGKNITPHKLRATYGTMLYNRTKDIYFVQECMEHASVNTSRLYIREKDKKEKMKLKASKIMEMEIG